MPTFTASGCVFDFGLSVEVCACGVDPATTRAGRAAASASTADDRQQRRTMHRTVPSLLLLLLAHAAALDNGVGRRPPLGYNTWNDLGPRLSSALLRSRVDAMVSSGLRDAGYVYFNLDDGWASDARGADGRLSADPDKFPEGMRNFSDYVHAKGLKLGLYTDRGTETCARKPGSYGFEKIDAQQYAEWQIDYLKEDNCKAPGGPNNRSESLLRFSLMRDALNATGRPIFFSVCGGGDQLPWNDLSYFASPPFGAALANSWRVSPDATGYLRCDHIALHLPPSPSISLRACILTRTRSPTRGASPPTRPPTSARCMRSTSTASWARLIAC